MGIESDFNNYEIAEIEVKDRKYQAVIESYNKMLEQVPKDSVVAADIYSNIGGIYAEYEKNRSKAEEYLNKAIKIREDKNDDLGLAGDYTEMSKIYIYIGGDINEGMWYLDQAEDIYVEKGLNNVFGLAGVMTNKGHLYKKEMNYEDALKSYIKAEDIYNNRQEKYANIKVFIGMIYLEMKEYNLAEDKYMEAIKICEEEEDKYNIAEIQFQLAWLYDCMGNYEGSIEKYNQALEFYKTDQCFLIDETYVYNNMASAYAELGKFDEAIDFAIKSYNTLNKIYPVTNDNQNMKEHCKNKLKIYYQNWSSNLTDELFESWFADKIIQMN